MSYTFQGVIDVELRCHCDESCDIDVRHCGVQCPIEESLVTLAHQTVRGVHHDERIQHDGHVEICLTIVSVYVDDFVNQ